ncbi:MAG: hypothetical protein ABIB43_03050 [archaeon]
MTQETLSKPDQSVKRNDEKNSSPFEALSGSVTGMGSRLRVLEERYTNVRKKTQMTDQNLLEFEKDIRIDIRSLNEDLLEIKRSISEINEKMMQMASELKISVRQSEFRVVEKYVDMWQPMDFVTKDQFNKYLEDKKLSK